MKEEKKEKIEEMANTPPDTQVLGDIDDFIFEEEAYRCSEK